MASLLPVQRKPLPWRNYRHPLVFPSDFRKGFPITLRPFKKEAAVEPAHMKRALQIVIAALLTIAVFGRGNILSVSFQELLNVAGSLFSWFLVVFLYVNLFHRMFIKKGTARIDARNMPVLRPIPIPTKDRHLLAKPLVWIVEYRRWILMEDWCYELKRGGETITLVIPKDFEFDGASIPRLLWFLLNPIGLLLIPGLIHDYGYKHDQLWRLDEDGSIQPFTHELENGKRHWDSLFWEVGRQVNGFWLLNGLAWAAVVFGGGSAWRSHETNGKRDPATKPATAGQFSQ